MWLNLHYDLLKKWKSVVYTTFAMVFIYLTMVYLHPENTDWVGSENFSFMNTLRFVFIDQFLIECITVAITFRLLRFYATKLKLTELRLTVTDIVLYELKFLPALLISFLVFAPFTLTVRFLYHELPQPDWNIYFNEYFYSSTLYFSYLVPVLLIGYIIINANLIYQYNQHLSATRQDLDKSKRAKVNTRLWAVDGAGEVFLDIEKIHWIERVDRKTLVTSNEGSLRLKENISELEEKLDKNKFVRINRSTIVNLESVLNYSFWENDKYVVRMKTSDQEFVMSRDRLNKIKDRFFNLES